MKTLAKILAGLVLLLLVGFFLLRTPDTDPSAMRAKYGSAPSQFVALAGGQTIHLRDEGPRDGQPIVLLHGSNADLQTWQPWTQRLKDTYRIIRFDQIGHGLTGSATDGDYSQAAFVQTVDEVADKLGLDRFILGGNSMGGGIAMAYALAHPQRLDGLILVDAGGAPIKQEGGGNIGFTIARTPGVNRLMTQITPRSLIAKSLDQSVSNKALVTPQTVDRYWELLRYPGNRAATVVRFGQPQESFTAAEIEQVNVPTLIIWGEEDALIPFTAADWYDRHLPRSTLISYSGIGHLPMEETPDQSAGDVRKWIDELSLSSPTR